MAADILFEFRSLIQRADLASTQPSDKVMGAQSHQRMVNTLQKQITVLERKMQEVLYMRAVCVICTYMDQNYAFFSHQVQDKHDEMYSKYSGVQEELAKVNCV